MRKVCRWCVFYFFLYGKYSFLDRVRGNISVSSAVGMKGISAIQNAKRASFTLRTKIFAIKIGNKESLWRVKIASMTAVLLLLKIKICNENSV